MFCGNVVYHWFTNCRLEEIGAIATKEYSLEKNLEKMKTEWQDLQFNFVPYRDSVSHVTSALDATQGVPKHNYVTHKCRLGTAKLTTQRNPAVE